MILAPFLFARGIGAVPPRALKLALLAGAALAIHFGTFIPSLSYTSVSSATALVCSQAVWAALLGRVLGERLPARAWVGVGVCLAGVLLITGVDVSLDARALVGDALAFAGGVFGGVYIVTGGFVRRDLNTLAYTVICYGTCAVLLLVVCLVAGSPAGRVQRARLAADRGHHRARAADRALAVQLRAAVDQPDDRVAVGPVHRAAGVDHRRRGAVGDAAGGGGPGVGAAARRDRAGDQRAGTGERSSRVTDRPVSASMQSAEPTHQMQIAWIVKSSR